MSLIEYIIPSLLAIAAIPLATVLNYFILRRLFKSQTTGILDILKETQEWKEINELISKLKVFVDSKEAEEMLEDIKRILKEL